MADRVPTIVELITEYGELAAVPPEVLQLTVNSVWTQAIAEAQREVSSKVERPEGRAIDGLADLAELVLVSPRAATIERYRNRVLEVEAACLAILAVVDQVAGDTDDWIAKDPLRGIDEFERIAFASARDTTYLRLREVASEVASKADHLRGLL